MTLDAVDVIDTLRAIASIARTGSIALDRSKEASGPSHTMLVVRPLLVMAEYATEDIQRWKEEGPELKLYPSQQLKLSSEFVSAAWRSREFLQGVQMRVDPNFLTTLAFHDALHSLEKALDDLTQAVLAFNLPPDKAQQMSHEALRMQAKLKDFKSLEPK